MKDILGKGLIVHQGTDDFTSQPSGNAGAGSLFSNHKINRLHLFI
jgi:hypothetical protein